MPKVSVIIPTYNDAHYLGEAIQSVLDQTYQEFEIIVVDDGSKDNPRAVVDTFNDARIHYIRQENKGLPGARNTGIRAAQGEYLAFLDADDIFLPNKLADQSKSLETYPGVDLVVGGWILIDERRNTSRTVAPWQNWPELSLEAILVACPLMVHSVLLRRDAQAQVGFFDETFRWQEDRDFWVRLAVAGCKMQWERRIVCVRRWHENNMSHDVSGMARYALQVLDKLYDRSNLPGEVLALKDKAYAARCAGNAAWYYMAGQYVEGATSVCEAISLDPCWMDGATPKIIQWLVTVFADHPLAANRDEYLAGLVKEFPHLVPGITRFVRKAVAGIYMADVFTAYQENRHSEVWKNLPKGIRYDLSWLWNIGVWSIGVRSFFGIIFGKS